MTRDLAEIVHAERDLLRQAFDASAASQDIAFHSPCTLQHGQKVRGMVEALLTDAGMRPTAVPDAHLCCGSAGTYSVLQPEIATKLRDNKLTCLASGGAGHIATANIGCLGHLQSGTALPVRHWIEFIDARMRA